MNVKQYLPVFQFALTLLFGLHLPAGLLAQDDTPESSIDRPNILWLTTEDIGPQLGCYGDEVAATPNLDEFAARSLRYRTAWSNYPVCAPARTTIISGRYACADGAGNMRSSVPLPQAFSAFPVYLKEQGYYCTNNSKTDYNYNNLQGIWDESSRNAHWKNREVGQPFFAVVNQFITHESRIRQRPHEAVTDPASVQLSPYWPDTPEVRQDWAQYYDNLITMDNWFGRQLKELEEAGLSEDTIVLFFGDHGSGMPRHKRYAGDSGLRVPFILHVPEKYSHLMPDEYQTGGSSDRLVSFVDLAPTMLSLIGVAPKEFMQGSAFAGQFETPHPEYMYGFRERMDERPDVSHLIRDKKFLYVRNYRSDLIAGQFVDYQQQTPTTSVWYRMFNDGELNAIQSQFWSDRPVEQLFDLLADPHEVNNLANQALFSDIQAELSEQQRRHALAIGAQTLLPEPIQSAKYGDNLDRVVDPLLLEAVLDIAELASVVPDDIDSRMYRQRMELNIVSDSAAIRYWTARALSERRFEGVDGFAPVDLIARLTTDDNPTVAIAALNFLIRNGLEDQRQDRIHPLIDFADMTQTDYYTAVYALNAIESVREHLDENQLERVRGLPTTPANIKRGDNYVERLVNRFKSEPDR
ncbi:MAG: sulfatase [Planctomycetota bacterium]